MTLKMAQRPGQPVVALRILHTVREKKKRRDIAHLFLLEKAHSRTLTLGSCKKSRS
jgi:hypothetical protein